MAVAENSKGQAERHSFVIDVPSLWIEEIARQYLSCTENYLAGCVLTDALL